ncbi:MAG: AMP-binding protein [Mycolicibacterium neoaurum]|uniref:class I adenylate-forming enzyme family protein n=1 Tax=Mycolicibacterium neoaurum TaxID=1795 RepID=UPI002FF81272
MTAHITDGLRFWAEAAPHRAAIVFDGSDTVDFRTLECWSDTAAHDLTSAGLRPGERVAIIGENSLEWCVAALGVLKAGAVVTPFNNRFTSSELKQLVEDADPAMVLTDVSSRERMLDALSDRNIRMRSLVDIAALRVVEHRPFDRHVTDFDDVAIIIYTSGTTSRPKGVTITHRSAFSFMAEMALAEPALRPGGRMIFTLSMAGAPGLPWHVLQSLTRGMTLFYERGFAAESVLSRLTTERIEIMCGVPVQFEQIAAQPGFSDADLSSLRLVTIAGARIPLGTVQSWLAKGVPLRQAYGMTELNGFSTLNPAEEAMTRPESIGRGSVFTRHRVVRPDGTDCDPGECGEIVVNGPSIMPGYWRNPEATAAAWRDGWFHTGDLAVVDGDGFIKVVDRMKDLIISGGFNIAPSEIEAVIADVPGVQDVCVISVPDAKFGEVPAAIVYATEPVDEPSIVEHCKRHLAGFKVPKHVRIEPEPLPRMVSGKIARREIRALHADLGCVTSS